MLDELGGYGVIIILVILLILYVLVAVLQLAVYVLAGLYTALAVLGGALLAALDSLFSARLVEGVPEAGWMFAGALLGAGVGAWTIAPVYGLRRARPLLLILPVLLVCGLMAYMITRQPEPLRLGVAVEAQPRSSELVIAVDFHGLSGAPDNDVVELSINKQPTSAWIQSLAPNSTETAVPLPGAFVAELEPFEVRVAPRQDSSTQTPTRHAGWFHVQILDATAVVASLALRANGSLVHWNESAQAWQRLGEGKSGELAVQRTRRLGLAQMVTVRRVYTLKATVEESREVRHAAGRGALAVSFPRASLRLSLTPQGQEELLPAVEQRRTEERAMASAFGEALALSFEFREVRPARGTQDAPAALYFTVGGAQVGPLTPLGAGVARTAVQRGQFDTATEHREIEHQIWRQSDEVSVQIRFCHERRMHAPADGMTQRAQAGSYIVTLHGRNADFNVSFEINADGTMDWLQEDYTEQLGVRQRQNYLSLPVGGQGLPGDPAYLTASFELTEVQELTVTTGYGRQTDLGTWSFPQGTLQIGFALRAGPLGH